MSGRTAHILEQKWRSDDIKIGEDADFSSLLLPKELLKGLTGAGFKYPSPIQLNAIPVGKIGKDLIVQAKSGTGKTLVFTVVALNMLLKGAKHTQVLIMAPTREIACQICQVIKCVGVPYKGLACEYFIGGRKLDEDIPRIQGCQIIVGTPGRIKQLISCKILNTAGIRLFVLDEADTLLKESSFMTDIDDIFRALPRDKQMIATSATYPNKLKRLTDKYFRDPLLIRLNMKDIGLLGMVHYYRVIPVSKLPVIAYKEKLKFLENVLLSVKFAQCLVFCNMVSRVENLCVEIKKWGFATSYISSAREQEDRLKAIELLKKFKCKVLVSSDISSRGIDAENVDLVINFDLPSQLDTYFHRVGRAGRYGSKCASVTFITSDEIEAYQRMQTDGKFKSYPLPDHVPLGLVSLRPKTKLSVKNEELPLDDGSNPSSDSSDDGEDLYENGAIKQEKAAGVSEDIEKNEELSLDDASKPSSDSSDEDLNENGVIKQEKVNGVNEDIEELNGHKEFSSTCKVDEFVSENLTNHSVDSEVASIESGDSHEMQNQLFDLNSNPENSLNEDEDMSNTSESVELELDKIDSSVSVKVKEPEVFTKVSSLIEIGTVKEENNLKSNKSDCEKSCENKKLVERKLDQQNFVTSVEESIENFHPKSDRFVNHIHGLQQITDPSSCLVDLENDSKKLLKEKTLDNNLLVIDNEHITSKNFNNPKSKELITSFITFVKEYEDCNKVSDKFSTSSVESINVVSNDSKFSSRSLELYRSDLSQYHYNVRKDFIVNSLDDLINVTAQKCGKECVNKGSEIEEETHLKQNDDEKKIQNSSLDLQPMLFSTPKVETLAGDSSGLESSSGSDKDKLIEHFNLRLASIQKVKPSASASESSSGSESNLDTSVNSEDALYMLTKEFNKVSQERAKCYNKKAANIVNYAESSSSCSTDSDSGTSIDSDKAGDELEKKFTEFIKTKRNDRVFSEDTEETKKILREIQSTKKDFKGIEIVDTKKHSEPSTSTSFDSDGSIDNGKAKDEHKKELNKKTQNVKSKVVNTKKSSESTSYKTKTINGHAENKITYYYSETESDVDQYSKESHSGLQDGLQRKTLKKSQTASKSNSGYRTKTVNGPLENKITYYYSGIDSSETENNKYSKKSGSSLHVGYQRKRKSHKKDETLPKTEPSQFDYSNATGTSNPYFNPASERQSIFQPHSNYERQPSYYASNLYNGQYSQQRPNYTNQEPFLGAHSNYQMQPTCYAPNPYYPSHPQQVHNHANNGQFLNTQSGHYLQPTYVPNPQNHSYPIECPLKESCQMHKVRLGSKPAGSGHSGGCLTDNCNFPRNSNPCANNVQSGFQLQPPPYAYNQCLLTSQHPCHPPNETCQSPACAAWYDIFYKQWQFINRSPYF